MKMQIQPPTKSETRYLYSSPSNDVMISAWWVVIEIGGRYRGHRGLALECQRDLLRYTAINGGRISPGLAGDRAPFIFFARSTVDAWLNAGGRSWIIAELEARSGRRVIAFPTKGGAA